MCSCQQLRPKACLFQFYTCIHACPASPTGTCYAAMMWVQCVIAVINNAALVWLGSVFSPLLPVFGAMCNVITFYTKRTLAMWLYEPPTTNFSASRTSIMGYSLMLGLRSTATVLTC